MVRVLTAPEQIDRPVDIRATKIFLAGGITNCPNWQKELIELLQGNYQPYGGQGLDPRGQLLLINPRRDNFPIDDSNASTLQIAWEYRWLRDADALVFWFSKGTDNPIVLFEYGNFGFDGRPVFLGVDSGYSREGDVAIQTALRPHGRYRDTHISIEYLAASICATYSVPKGEVRSMP